MYIPLLSVARGHRPLHCENTQVLREAITEDDDDELKVHEGVSQSKIRPGSVTILVLIINIVTME